MRLWSIHPKYLDSKGLVALWRESLLAQKVLRGETRGYRHHPQLERFKETARPVAAIATYLRGVQREASRREFAFDRDKIGPAVYRGRLNVSDGQVSYEVDHLKRKLWVRDRSRYFRLEELREIEVHPIFHRVAGPVAEWEIVS